MLGSHLERVSGCVWKYDLNRAVSIGVALESLAPLSIVYLLPLLTIGGILYLEFLDPHVLLGPPLYNQARPYVETWTLNLYVF